MVLVFAGLPAENETLRRILVRLGVDAFVLGSPAAVWAELDGYHGRESVEAAVAAFVA